MCHIYQEISAGGVSVLLQEAACVVEDDPGKVVDSECCAGVGSRLEVILILAVLLMEPLYETHISCFRKLGLFINEGENIHRFLSDHVECGLVVDESNLFPVDSLFSVLFLFHLEDVLHKKLLKVFVCIINAELFKTVVLKILEAENVQNPDSTFVSTNFSFENSSIDFLDVSI